MFVNKLEWHFYPSEIPIKHIWLIWTFSPNKDKKWTLKSLQQLASFKIELTRFNKLIKALDTYPSSVFCGVISSKYGQGWTPANSNLLHKWHQVVWNSLGVLPNISTRVRSNRIEVSEQYNLPFRIRLVNVTTDFFDEKLKCITLYVIINFQGILQR